MRAKPFVIAAALTAMLGASSVVLAQDETEDETQDRFMRMHEMTEAFQATDNPMQRRMLMHDHMMMMQDQMAASGGMMMGGHMMHGDSEAPNGGDVDMDAIRAQMMVMHQMMTEIMAQQHMMMQLDEPEETDDVDE
ncbi:MAG: hypothetical protein PVI23_02385 [Maricaulaceae bacterium]|jgi:hypothetical protein